MPSHSPDLKEVSKLDAVKLSRVRALTWLLFASGSCGFLYPVMSHGQGAWPRDVASIVTGIILWGMVPVLHRTRSVKLIMRTTIPVGAVCFFSVMVGSGDVYYAALGMIVPVAACLFCEPRDAILATAGYLIAALSLAVAIETQLVIPPFKPEQYRLPLIPETCVLGLLILAICSVAIRKEKLFEDAMNRELDSISQVKAQQRRFEMVCHSAHDAILDLDRYGRIVWISGTLFRITGFAPAEMLGMRATQFVTDSDRRPVFDAIVSADATGAPFCEEVRIDDSEGQSHWCRVSGGSYLAADGTHCLLVAVQEITSEVAARERMFELSRLQSLGNVCGGLAHDFNNLLTVIGIYGEMIKDAEIQRNILSAQKQAADVTAGLLTFARRETFVSEIVVIADFLMQLRPMVDRMVPDNVACLWSVNCDSWVVQIDPSQLQQVVINLVSNSLYAMPNGGQLEISASVDSTVVERNDVGSTPVKATFLLSVSDTGSGVSDETIAHAFEPFYTTKPRGKGTGLGLSTVHGVVSRAAGKCSIRNNSAKGTTIDVQLPAEFREVVPQPDDLAEAEYNHVLMAGNVRVLLVDDRFALAEALKCPLENIGYSVTLCPDAEQALEVLATGQQFDVLVTDIVLPQMSGISLSRMARERSPELRVVLISGYQQDDLAIVREQPEITRFLAKPFRAQQLLIAISELLNGTDKA